MAELNPSLWRPAQDLTKRVFENETVELFLLHRAALQAGEQMLKEIVFRNCLLQGPAVLLMLDGNALDGCDLGDSKDDIRSLLLRPVSPTRVTGALPTVGCHFDACCFNAVGFTGGEAFLQQIIAIQPGLEG